MFVSFVCDVVCFAVCDVACYAVYCRRFGSLRCVYFVP